MVQRDDPPPEEIRRLCREIQESWDTATERLRAGCYAEAERVKPHAVSLAEIVAASR